MPNLSSGAPLLTDIVAIKFVIKVTIFCPFPMRAARRIPERHTM